jgi:ABC-2 type transport system ATP-binding protein
MIQIREVTKKYPTLTALQSISLSIQQGEFFGLLGPNGAGKSTLMNLLVGYLDPDEGELIIHGERVSRDNLAARRMIGFVPQSLALYDEISAYDNLEIFAGFFHVEKKILRERINDQLHAVQLYDRRKDKVKSYSGGMKRRLNLIASLLHDPPLLLCDEPTVGVDPQSRNAIFDYLTMLNRGGKTIVYTTHYMEEVERLCQRIAILDEGKIIAEGTIDALLHSLPYEESISIVKNDVTRPKIDLFRRFGPVTDRQESFELAPEKTIRLSDFFSLLEKENIDCKWVDIRKPTLEELFLRLTGRRLRD